jgi:RNA polymerase sigma-70 factor (ECF subfamily)
MASETFALAFSRRASFRGSGNALPWLYGIATNVLHRQRRKERRELRAYSRSGTDVWATYEDEAAVRVDGSRLGARLAGALAAMRPCERDALLLYALADLSYDEVALALDVPVGTVRTWLHRGRATAQRELATAEANVSPLATTGVDLNG